MGKAKLTKPTKPTKSYYQKKTNNPKMGRPKIEYHDNWTKYSMKRPKYTPESFHAKKNECRVCGGTKFFHELQRPPQQPHYRTYGYPTKRVLWRIKCANAKCYEPYGVILKLEEWDSVEN